MIRVQTFVQLVAAVVALLSVESQPCGRTATPTEPATYLGVARQDGANNTQWRSEAILYNLARCDVETDYDLVLRGSAKPVAGTLAVPAGEPSRIADLFARVGAASGSGMVWLEGPTLQWLRTFNSGGGGTFGQGVASATSATAYGKDEAIYVPFSAPVDTRRDPRSNLLVANFEDRSLALSVESDGAAAVVHVPAHGYEQAYDMGKLLGITGGVRTAKLTGDGRWFGVVSTIDPFTGDPCTVRGLRPEGVTSPTSFIGVARHDGGNLARWRSEAVLHNPGAEPIDVMLDIVPRGQSAAVSSKGLTLGAGTTVAIPDVYDYLDAPAGVGTLRVNGKALAWVRTFNQTSTGTYGQEVPPASSVQALPALTRFYAPIAPSQRDRDDTRSNLLAVNLGAEAITVMLRAGVKTRGLPIPAGAYVQVSGIADWLGGVDRETILELDGSGPWFGFVSTIDGVTDDPTTVALLSPEFAVPNPNVPPEAVADSAEVIVDTSAAIKVLANDTDIDGDPLTVQAITTAPPHGTAAVNSDGTITYTPPGRYHGYDSFAYEISDGRGGVARAEVSLTVREERKKWAYYFYDDADFANAYNPAYDFRVANASSANHHVVVLEDEEDGPAAVWSINPQNLPTAIQKWGELNMGDGETLRRFLDWAKTFYPADRTILAMYDHGGAWQGACIDKSASNDILSMQEIHDGIAGAGGVTMLLFTAPCLMGALESVYELRDCVEVYIGSENLSGYMWWHGTIEQIARLCQEQPEIETEALATAIIASIKSNELSLCSRYGLSDHPLTMSAVRARATGALATAVDALAQALLAAPTRLRFEVGSAVSVTRLYSTYVADLSDFANQLSKLTTSAATRAAAERVRSALSEVVIAEAHGADMSGSTGLTVYLPPPGIGYSSTYEKVGLDFAADTHWKEVLSSYCVARYSPPESTWDVLLPGGNGLVFDPAAPPLRACLAARERR